MLMSVQTGAPCKWTSDGKQFILDNFDLIQDSPARIYDSAPVHCPPSSWLHGCYSTEFSQKIKAVVGPVGWGMCTRTVPCSDSPSALAYWNNTIAISSNHYIIIIDALTGSQTTALSEHTDDVCSLVFSSDGTLLVSGSRDKTIKLWDVQTGGVVKTLYGRINWVQSVSISADNTMIASGSDGRTICLWNIKTGSCHVIKEHVRTVTFSPTNPQLLLSSSDDDVQQWDIDGHQIGPSVAGSHVAFSPDGVQFALCRWSTITIRNTNSRKIIVQFSLPDEIRCCCFSPNGMIVAVATDSYIIYLWDITSPIPHLIQTLAGHTDQIYSLVFSSSLTLISPSQDRTVKFWQIGASSPNPLTVESAPIRTVSLQAKDGLAFSIDSEGVVKVWDILTGHCKESHITAAKDIGSGDIQLIGDALIIVGCDNHSRDKIYVRDAEKGVLQTMDTSYTSRLRITGDGSKVLQLGIVYQGFQMIEQYIQAWDLQTGESAGKVALMTEPRANFDPLCMDGSRILVQTRKSSTEGWDFGIPGSIPVQFSDRPQLNLIDIRWWSDSNPIRIKDNVTGREVFQLYGKYAKPSAIQWDGQYLIAGYVSGEVLILDFSHALAQ